MFWLAFFALVIAAPIAVLVWTRRDGRPGVEGGDQHAVDPHAHRNYAADGGPTPHYGGPGTGTDNWGGGGNVSGTT
jgi:hypothetical protein